MAYSSYTVHTLRQSEKICMTFMYCIFMGNISEITNGFQELFSAYIKTKRENLYDINVLYFQVQYQ